MRYLHTMVRVKNLEEALDWYCDKLGLHEMYRVDNDEGKYTLVFLAASADVEFAKERNTPLLELTYNWQTQDYTSGKNFGHIAYAVDNIYDTCQKLMDAGIIINRPPRDGRMAFVVSPDGISIELLQQGESLAPQEPWSSMQNTGTW